MEVEMKIRGLMVDPVTNMPIVVLKDVNGMAILPIWVGVYEANAIALRMREALEVPGQTAALVTPDRDLARRVQRNMAAALGRPPNCNPASVSGAGVKLHRALRTDAVALCEGAGLGGIYVRGPVDTPRSIRGYRQRQALIIRPVCDLAVLGPLAALLHRALLGRLPGGISPRRTSRERGLRDRDRDKFRSSTGRGPRSIAEI